MTPGDMINNYLKLRRKLEKIAERHKQELEPYLELKNQLEVSLLAHLHEAKVDSTKSEAGTAFKATATSVTVKDWNKTLPFIIENELWDLLEGRVAKNAAIEVIEERAAPIPGVEVSQTTVLRVRAG
jgi:hypothetical protein